MVSNQRIGDDTSLQAPDNTILEEWNEIALILIPKVDRMELITMYRPIVLGNVVYMVIFKVLSNMLKSILPQIISLTQSAFFLGRLIIDNVLVAYKRYHAIDNHAQGGNDICIGKLDMHKAYDRVESDFLQDMMLPLDFNMGLINMIMACVTSVNYRV